MPVVVCDDHQRGFKNYLGFMGHWRFVHKSGDPPPEDSVTVDELPDGYSMAESSNSRGPAPVGDEPEAWDDEPSPEPLPAPAPKAKRPRAAGKPATSASRDAPDRMPDDTMGRTRVSLGVHQFPDTLITYVLNLLKMHPEAQNDPTNYSNFLNWICSTSSEGKRHAMKVPMIVMEVFPQEVQDPALTPYVPGRSPYPYPSNPYQPGMWQPGGPAGSQFGPGPWGPPGPYGYYYPPPQQDNRLEKELQEFKEEVRGLMAEVAAPRTPEAQTITMPDEHGRPITVPYTQELADAMRRRTDAEARAAERKELIEMVALLRPEKAKTEDDPVLQALREEVRASNTKVEALMTSLQEQRMETMRKEVEEARQEAQEAKLAAKESRDMAASAARGDKTVVDYMQEAGIEAKEAIQAAGKDLRSTVREVGQNLTSIATRTPPPPAPPEIDGQMKPQDLADLMETEDAILNMIGGR